MSDAQSVYSDWTRIEPEEALARLGTDASRG